MSIATEVTLITGIAATIAALTGYWITQHTNRREQRSRVFAEALQAISEYQELPYLIRHRANESEATRSDLTQRISAVFGKISYYQALLQLESRVVGDAYETLFERTRKQGGPHRKDAWESAPLSKDEQVPGSAYYIYDNEPELRHCIASMRRELTPWAALIRARTRREHRQLAAERPTPPGPVGSLAVDT
jgi:hypothetical protein